MALNRDLMQTNDIDEFTREVEKRLSMTSRDRIPFAVFLEEKMNRFDYSNTALAKMVYHKTTSRKDGSVSYVPVTRQAVGSWLKGSMPTAREIYVTLGMAFHMDLDEINHILLETYMGYGLYCKNIEDALWIAVINGLFDIQEIDRIREQVEEILNEEDDEDDDLRSLPTTDLWVMLAEAESPEEFFHLISRYRREFREGARQFGICLQEVIEEEYGYYEKAAWFLRDIGCLHCEAQFSKIRAGKAVVTREWLLRFCLSLQPSYESVEILLAKAQMEPLGISPVEVIIEMICKYKTYSLANTQEMWILIETLTENLREKGYDIDEDLCRKYNAVYDLPVSRKWWLSCGIGAVIRQNQKNRDYGYEKTGYCRYASVDRVLFDDVNRCKKNSVFKAGADLFKSGTSVDLKSAEFNDLTSLSVDRREVPDIVDMEKFADYCYMRKPSRFSQDFLMNDVYYYCALLYTIWTGKCFRKDGVDNSLRHLSGQMKQAGVYSDRLMEMLTMNLKDDAVYREDCSIPRILEEFIFLSYE